MPTVYFITHPEVTVDPATPVPQWGLSEAGRQRMQAFVDGPALPRLAAVYCSEERKAVEAARLLAGREGLAALGENDRSATGFLPKERFEAAADAFFAAPELSFRGWERAADAQRRIVAAVERVLREAPAGDVAIVSHGAVGTLYKCHLKGMRITRREDQPSQGHCYAFDRGSGRLLHDWQALPPAEVTRTPNGRSR